MARRAGTAFNLAPIRITDINTDDLKEEEKKNYLEQETSEIIEQSVELIENVNVIEQVEEINVKENVEIVSIEGNNNNNNKINNQNNNNNRGSFRGKRGGRGSFRGKRGGRGNFRGTRGGRGSIRGTRGGNGPRGSFRAKRGGNNNNGQRGRGGNNRGRGGNNNNNNNKRGNNNNNLRGSGNLRSSGSKDMTTQEKLDYRMKQVQESKQKMIEQEIKETKGSKDKIKINIQDVFSCSSFETLWVQCDVVPQLRPHLCNVEILTQMIIAFVNPEETMFFKGISIGLGEEKIIELKKKMWFIFSQLIIQTNTRKLHEIIFRHDILDYLFNILLLDSPLDSMNVHYLREITLHLAKYQAEKLLVFLSEPMKLFISKISNAKKNEIKGTPRFLLLFNHMYEENVGFLIDEILSSEGRTVIDFQKELKQIKQLLANPVDLNNSNKIQAAFKGINVTCWRPSNLDVRKLYVEERFKVIQLTRTLDIIPLLIDGLLEKSTIKCNNNNNNEGGISNKKMKLLKELTVNNTSHVLMGVIFRGKNPYLLKGLFTNCDRLLESSIPSKESSINSFNFSTFEVQSKVLLSLLVCIDKSWSFDDYNSNKPKVVLMKKVLDSMCTSIVNQGKSLLLDPPKNTICIPKLEVFNNSTPKIPFGILRLRLVIFICQFVRCKFISLFKQQIIDSNLINIILDLFFQYSHHYFLHEAVSNSLILPLLSNKNNNNNNNNENSCKEDLLNHLIVDCKLTERIINNYYQHDNDSPNLNTGYNGHLTTISNIIRSNNILLKPFIKNNPNFKNLENWKLFVNNALIKTNKIQNPSH